jgi:hypothetical protein
MSEQDNILSFGPEGDGKTWLSEEKLMAYLAGKLSPAEQHEIEQWLADEGMESDALEGLHGQKTEDTRHTISRLNHHLRKTLIGKKRRRKPLQTNQFSWIAIVVILLLVVIAYIVIRKMTHN